MGGAGGFKGSAGADSDASRAAAAIDRAFELAGVGAPTEDQVAAILRAAGDLAAAYGDSRPDRLLAWSLVVVSGILVRTDAGQLESSGLEVRP